MGRMADLLRHAERARFDSDAGTVAAVAEPTPTRPATVEPSIRVPAPEPEPESFEEPESTIPFIEVGEVYEPSIRLARPAPDPVQPPIVVVDAAVVAPSGSGIISVRFQPVHAGKLSGRGFGPELVAFHQPEHPVGVQYRSLVAEISTQLPGTRPRLLAFVAPSAEAGATTVLLNLAVTLARQDTTRVAVVDAHPDRPAIAARLGIAAKPGFREVLARHTPMAWSLQETAQPNLVALTAGHPATPWVGDEVQGALELLRGRADWVLVDAGCWDTSAPAAVIAEACDAVYLVHRHDADSTAIQSGILEATGKLRGCILTQA